MARGSGGGEGGGVPEGKLTNVSSPRRRRGEGDHPEPSAEDGGGVLTARPICYPQPMATLKVTLPPALDRFVQNQVAAGDWPDAETLIHEAVLRLMPADQADAFRLERLNALLQIGLDQIDRGEVVEVTDIRAFIDEIEAEVEAEFSDRAA